MKHFKNIFVFLALIILCSSCSAKKSNIIYDYKSIEIESTYTDITQQDIKDVILLDFSSKEYYREDDSKTIVGNDDTILIDVNSSDEDLQATDIYYNFGDADFSDEIDDLLLGKSVGDTVKCNVTYNEKDTNIEIKIKSICKLYDVDDEQALKDFYGLNSKDEAYEYLTERTKNEIIFNYMWDEILNNSEINAFPANIVEKIKTQSNLSLTDEENKENEENKEICNYYFELTVAEIILNDENAAVTDSDIESTKNKFSEKNGIAVDELSQYVSEDDIYYTAVMDKLKPILISYANIIN